MGWYLLVTVLCTRQVLIVGFRGLPLLSKHCLKAGAYFLSGGEALVSRMRRKPNICVIVCICLNLKLITTYNGGSLGSHIDEERSEMRYVMRIADPVSHRIFERILRPPGIPEGLSG